MFTKQQIFQNTNWGVLIVLSGLIFAAVLLVLQEMTKYITPPTFIQFFLIMVGCVSISTGYLVTKSRRYELSPLRSQIFGSLIDGFFLSIMLYASLVLLLIFPSGAAIMIYAVATIFCIEFISQRITQRRKVTLWQIIASILVGFSVYLMTSTLPMTAVVMLLSILLSSIIMNVIGRLSGTQLLSPWVNSFWNGISLALVGLIGAPLLAGLTVGSALTGMLFLPLWIGFAVLGVAVLLLSLRLLKHKTRLSKGYLQYKLQVATGVLALIALVFMDSFSTTTLFVFLLLVVAYAVAEARLTIKE